MEKCCNSFSNSNCQWLNKTVYLTNVTKNKYIHNQSSYINHAYLWHTHEFDEKIPFPPHSSRRHLARHSPIEISSGFFLFTYGLGSVRSTTWRLQRLKLCSQKGVEFPKNGRIPKRTFTTQKRENFLKGIVEVGVRIFLYYIFYGTEDPCFFSHDSTCHFRRKSTFRRFD